MVQNNAHTFASIRMENSTTGVNNIIIPVDELERRKERFRRATKEYYEQAEHNFRFLHGFCNSSSSTDPGSQTIGKRTRENSPLKRCRSRRRMEQAEAYKPRLESELALRLLESHFRIVELAIGEYLVSIQSLMQPIGQLQHSGSNPERNSLEPTLQLSSLLFAEHQPCECLQSLLHRHYTEAVEEQDKAMASKMASVKECKITGELAKKILEHVDSIRVALRRLSSLRGNVCFYCHLDEDANCGTSTQDMAIVNHNAPASWDRTVVEALKLDGYYRWFRANNGVLLRSLGDNKTTSTSSNSHGIKISYGNKLETNNTIYSCRNKNTRDEQESGDVENCRRKRFLGSDYR